jgi:8-oxo-dGTP pyrophosphatase MutT (NUDIX family)
MVADCLKRGSVSILLNRDRGVPAGNDRTCEKMKTRSPKEKAGVVVYRATAGGEAEVLLVSARKFKDQWVFPVGSVKTGESLEAAARRECEEESGFRVEIGHQLPAITLPGNGPMKRFTFFLATVVGEAAVWETDRQRTWVPVSRLVEALPDVFHGTARHAVEHLLK